MKQRKWGRIVNIASNWGLTGAINRSDYVTTKHGLIGLTKAVALEALPYNVTCNAICPGSILTPHAERQVKERMARDNQDWDNRCQGISSDEAAVRPLRAAGKHRRAYCLYAQPRSFGDDRCADVVRWRLDLYLEIAGRQPLGNKKAKGQRRP